MTDMLAIVSFILCVAAIVSLATRRLHLACALAFAAGITIGALAHTLESAS